MKKMANYNRKEHLNQLHIQRKAITQKKVDEAINRLIKLKKTINFNSVANEANVSKATLYNDLNIKERISSLRCQQSKVSTPAQVKRDTDDNNKDAIIESLKRKIKKLDDENKLLREQLKFSYADVYKKI